jgi:hypothetical protein
MECTECGTKMENILSLERESGANMLNLKELSKQKYIYRIYESSDRVLHCEKYPVIYINSEVVYYKDGRKKECLNYARVSSVGNDFAKYYTSYYYSCFDGLFWNVDEPNIEKIYKDIREQMEITKKKDEKDKAEAKLNQAKLEYERALKAVELFKDK